MHTYFYKQIPQTVIFGFLDDLKIKHTQFKKYAEIKKK